MANETKLVTRRYRHKDRNKLFGKATNEVTVDLPAHRPDKFTRYTVHQMSQPSTSGYTVVQAPKPGAAGKLVFRIDWWHYPFSEVAYELTVYVGKPRPVTIVADTGNWLPTIRDAIDQGQRIDLRVRGIKARDLYRQILMLAPRDTGPSIHIPMDLFFDPVEQEPMDGEDSVIWEDVEEQPDGPAADPVVTPAVLITFAIVAGVVAVAGFATLGSVLMMALHRNYEIKTTCFKAGTLVGDYELCFDLVPSR